MAKVRPRTTTSRSRSDARTRPVSAPSERVKCRPRSASSKHNPIVFAPSLASASNTVVNGISRAELEAWATLSQTRRPRESRPTAASFDRARPNSAAEHRSSQYLREGGTPGRGRTTTTAVPASRVDMHRCSLEQFGSGHGPAAVDAATPGKASGAALLYQRAAQATPLPSTGKYSYGLRGTADGSCNRGSYHDGPGYNGCGRQMPVRDQDLSRAEHDAGHQREHQQDRSDISVRCVALHSCACYVVHRSSAEYHALGVQRFMHARITTAASLLPALLAVCTAVIVVCFEQAPPRACEEGHEGGESFPQVDKG